MQQVSLDEAIQNLDKILAHILVEQDLKLKGIQIGHGWQQLSTITTVITKMSFLDRRKYKRKLREMQDRLNVYEDNFISECEMKMAIDDVQKVNDLLNNHKSQIILERRKEIEEKLSILKEELIRIVEKNKKRTDSKWIETIKQATAIIQQIHLVLTSNNPMQYTNHMNTMLKTMYVSKRMKEEEEEELLKIAQDLERNKLIQAELDKQLYKDDQSLDQIGDKQNVLNQNQNKNLENYSQANQFVQRRRRTKIKLFFQGLFTAIGAFGGKLGAAIGLAFGTITGKKAADAMTKCE